MKGSGEDEAVSEQTIPDGCYGHPLTVRGTTVWVYVPTGLSLALVAAAIQAAWGKPEQLAEAIWDARETRDPSGRRADYGDGETHDPLAWREVVERGIYPGSQRDAIEEAQLVLELLARPTPVCPRCHGEGSITFNPSKRFPPDPQMEDTAKCPDCNGTGLTPEGRRDA